MLRRILYLYNGHKDTCHRHDVDPSAVMLIRQIIHNLWRFKVVVDTNGCYAVYEIVRRYHLGFNVILINGVYCPEEKRGNGYISRLYDKISEKHGLPIMLFHKSDGYSKVGEVYLRG